MTRIDDLITESFNNRGFTTNTKSRAQYRQAVHALLDGTNAYKWLHTNVTVLTTYEYIMKNLNTKRKHWEEVTLKRVHRHRPIKESGRLSNKPANFGICLQLKPVHPPYESPLYDTLSAACDIRDIFEWSLEQRALNVPEITIKFIASKRYQRVLERLGKDDRDMLCNAMLDL